MTGQELKTLRKKYGYTQKVLAEEIGINPVRITEWETERLPMAKITQRMFEYFFKLKEKEM